MMNTTKPFLPEYTGPDAGWALWVHHEVPLEYCTSFKERIEYIELNEPASEIPARRAALTWIPDDAIDPRVVQARATYTKARDTHTKARDTHTKAWDTHTKAWAAYTKAWDTHTKAWAAYTKARAAYWPSLVAQYAPEVRHDCGVLKFS